MRRSVQRFACWALGLFLGTVAGCGESENPPEYGVPRADFILSGTVTDATTGDPIQGIAVVLENGWAEIQNVTNADGVFGIENSATCIGVGCETQNLLVEDVDGAANGGTFVSKTVALSATQTAPGDGHWHEGTYEQSGISIELDKE